MSQISGKKIILFQQRSWGKVIGRFLAKKIYDEGGKLAALTFKRSTHELIKVQPDLKYDLIINNDEVMSEPKKYLGSDDFTLEEICKNLGIQSIWPIVSTLRNHVKSYKEKYYYSYKQNVPDEEIIDFIKAAYKYTKKFFDEFKPDLVIAANFVAFPHIMFNLYGKQRGVPMMAVTDSKIKGIYLFVYAYQDNEGAFFDRLKILNADYVKSKNLDRARKYIADFRRNFIKPQYANYETPNKTFLEKIRFELSPYMNILRWYRKKPIDVLKSTGITIDYRPPRIILRDHYAEKRYKKYTDNFKYYPLDKIKKYVYFPLQFQPEASIDVFSPYASNQMETARLVAMSLPSDYTLVVKEHPGMVGKRPPSYTEKIARTVNIKLVDYRLSSEQVLKGADLLISPGSTTVAEAAFLGKPAIQLGDLGTTLMLPNVHKHSDMATLTKKIIEVLNTKVDVKEYERKLENYVAAVYDTGFDVDYLGAWEKGKSELREPLWQTYKKEIERILSKK